VRDVQLLVVQRDGKGMIAQRRGPLDQLLRGVRNPVDRVGVRMSVKLDFQAHAPDISADAVAFKRLVDPGCDAAAKPLT